MNRLKKFLGSCLLFFSMLLPHEGRSAAARDTIPNNKTPVTVVAVPNFSLWLKNLRKDARVAGISQKTINAALPDTLQLTKHVVALDRKQPETTTAFADYIKAVLSAKRIDTGLARMETFRADLDTVSKVYNVEPEVIVALWGIETNYGKNTGTFNVIPALATLAYDGRRSVFFRSELIKALQIVDEGHISLSALKGSWAGAMGQTQFMPSAFLSYAVDFDKDGRRDIWKNHKDIFASVANYLSQSGWHKGESWGHRVDVPDSIDRKLLSLDVRHSVQFWRDKGVKLESGGLLPSDGSALASVIQPDGPGTEALLVFDNYRVFMKWNYSKSFAASAGLLSDKFKR